MRVLTNQFLEAMTGAESWPTALTRMADTFGGIESHFTVWDRAEGRVLFSARAGRFPPEASEKYTRYFHTVDTCKEALIWSEVGQVFLTQTHYGEAFTKTEIYNDFLRPLGARHVMGVKLADNGAAVAMLRIHKSGRHGPYSEQDVLRLIRLFPSLSCGAQLYFDRMVSTQAAQLATAALDQLDIAVIVTDRDGRVLHRNSLADRILATSPTIKIESGRLNIQQMNVSKLVKANESLAARRRVSSGISPRLDYDLAASFLREGCGSTDTSKLLITLKKVDYPAVSVALELRTEFGLTEREAAIAEQIVAGRTLRQIARDDLVTVNTVKTHLRAVFTKTNVHSQSELVRAALKINLVKDKIDNPNARSLCD